MPRRILPAPPQRVSFEEKKGDVLIFQKDTLIRQAFPGAWRAGFYLSFSLFESSLAYHSWLAILRIAMSSDPTYVKASRYNWKAQHLASASALIARTTRGPSFACWSALASALVDPTH
jgi:hypothetical protein